MKKNSVFAIFILRLLGAAIALAAVTGCGIQSIPQAKNAVEAQQADVLSQYQRRADLIPNLVQTVKGYAKHEEETLTAVVEARAKATQTSINPANADSVKSFEQAQGLLGQALSRLMVVVEKYPDLKANQNFLDLQSQLEGTENRLAVARTRHIKSIEAFNNLVTVPPTSWTNSLIYHHEKMAQWTVADPQKIQETPKVEF